MEHRFQFKRGELELTLSGERDFVEAQIAAWLPRLMGLADGPAPEAPAPGALSLDVRAEASVPETQAYPRVSASFAPRRNISLGDLITLKEATAPADLLVVSAYYFEKYLQQDAYTADELQRELAELPAWSCQEAAEVVPLVVLQGYLEALRDDRYTLTFKGQTYVRDGLA